MILKKSVIGYQHLNMYALYLFAGDISAISPFLRGIQDDVVFLFNGKNNERLIAIHQMTILQIPP
jgi:hypothetical protein